MWIVIFFAKILLPDEKWELLELLKMKCAIPRDGRGKLEGCCSVLSPGNHQYHGDQGRESLYKEDLPISRYAAKNPGDNNTAQEEY